jgi:hypothetical protein
MLQFLLQSLNFSLIIEVFENTGDFESYHDGAAVEKIFPFTNPYLSRRWPSCRNCR